MDSREGPSRHRPYLIPKTQLRTSFKILRKGVSTLSHGEPLECKNQVFLPVAVQLSCIIKEQIISIRLSRVGIWMPQSSSDLYWFPSINYFSNFQLSFGVLNLKPHYSFLCFKLVFTWELLTLLYILNRALYFSKFYCTRNGSHLWFIQKENLLKEIVGMSLNCYKPRIPDSGKWVGT